MKMVYIPPFDMLSDHFNDSQLLMLPHLAVRNKQYSYFFQQRRPKYTILDNGANEGEQATSEQLVELSQEFGVDELVLPDVMGDFDQTMGLSLDFVKKYENETPWWTKFGFVLHGKDEAEVMRGYRYLRKSPLHNYIRIIYIPRMLVTPELPNARINLAFRVASYRSGKLIHFLGAAPSNIREIQDARKILGARTVRSMDTSAPFVYALASKSVSSPGVYPRDHATYFDSYMEEGVRRLAKDNCGLMDSWVK